MADADVRLLVMWRSVCCVFAVYCVADRTMWRRTASTSSHDTVIMSLRARNKKL